MEVVFDDDDLERLYVDPRFTMGLSQALVRVYRKRMQSITSAVDERDFYNLKSLHYEKLKGARQHQRSMRLNEQYRLTLEIEDLGTKKHVRIIAIEDYH